MAILGHFWAIFGPINLYRNLPAGRHTPLALSAITFDSETLAQKVIPFWKALEIGYLIPPPGALKLAKISILAKNGHFFNFETPK